LIIALIFVLVEKGNPVAVSAGTPIDTTDFDDDDDYDDGF
ncbi:PTS sugar transporter subunit IIC, partial [Enterococcus faecalis]